MKLVSTEAVMTALCQHCDSHIEMCEDCGMKEIIESVPSAWIKCSERLPQQGELVIVAKEDGVVSLGYCFQFAEHHLWNAIRLVPFSPYELPFVGAGHVTHWMPLPDAPEVEG